MSQPPPQGRDSDDLEVIAAAVIPARYGKSFNGNGATARPAHPLVKSPADACLMPTSQAAHTCTYEFVTQQALSNFTRSVSVHGLSVGGSLSGSIAGFGASASYEQAKQHTSAEANSREHKTSYICRTQACYMPKAMFVLDTDNMQLTDAALQRLVEVQDARAASDFLTDFGTHISSGTFQVGGAYLLNLEVHTEEAHTFHTMHTIAKKQMAAEVGASGWGITLEAKLERQEADVHEARDQCRRFSAKTTLHCQVLGPTGARTLDEFSSRLDADKRCWVVVDQDEGLGGLHGIWEVVRHMAGRWPASDGGPDGDHARQLRRAADMLWVAFQNSLVADMQRLPRLLRGAGLEAGVGGERNQLAGVARSGGRVGTDAVLAMLHAARLVGINGRLQWARADVGLPAFQMLLHCTRQQQDLHGMRLLPVVFNEPFGQDLLQLLVGLVPTARAQPTSDAAGPSSAAVAASSRLQLEPALVQLFKDLLPADVVSDIEHLGGRVPPQLLSLPTSSSHTTHLQQHQQPLPQVTAPTLAELAGKLQQQTGAQHVASVLRLALEVCAGADGHLACWSRLKRHLWSEFEFDSSSGSFLQPPGPEVLDSLIRDVAVIAAGGDPTSSHQRPAYHQGATKRNSAPVAAEALACIRSNVALKPVVCYHHIAWGTDTMPVELNLSTEEATMLASLRHHQEPPQSLIPADAGSTAGRRRTVRAGGSSTAAATPAAEPWASSRHTHQTQLQALLSLFAKSNLPARCELASRLLALRIMVPLIAPLPQPHEGPAAAGQAHCNVEALRHITMPLGISGREARLWDDTSLPCVVFLTLGQCDPALTRNLVEQVMQCKPLLGSRHASSLPAHSSNCCTNAPLLEVAMGSFKVEGAAANKLGAVEPCLVLCASGDLGELLPKLLQRADLVVAHAAEEDTHQLWQQSGVHTMVRGWQATTGASEVEDVVLAEAGGVDAAVWSTGGTPQLQAELPAIIQQALEPLLFGTAGQRQQPRRPLRTLAQVLPPGISCDDMRDLEFVQLRVQHLTAEGQPPLHQSSRVLQRLFAERMEAEFRQLARPQQQDLRLKRRIADKDAEMRRVATEQPPAAAVQLLLDVLQVRDQEARTMAVMELEHWLAVCTAHKMQDLRKERQAAYRRWQANKNDYTLADYTNAKEAVADHSVGTEHLWREVCHMFACSPDLAASPYPGLAAQHLLDGFPLELMDGDAGAVRNLWVKAVFNKLDDFLLRPAQEPAGPGHPAPKRPAHLFSLAAVGAQSSGKSTMLNAQFGARFRTSAGMCTRGMHALLVACPSMDPAFDYILLVDTQGLQSPEFGGLPGAEAQDRRLAAMGVLPCELTQFTIWTEDRKTLLEILPLVLLARRGVSQIRRYPCELVLAINAVDVTQGHKLQLQDEELVRSFTDISEQLARTNLRGATGGTAHPAGNHQEPISRFKISHDPDDPTSDCVYLGFSKHGEGMEAKVNNEYPKRALKVWRRGVDKVKGYGGPGWEGLRPSAWGERLAAVQEHAVYGVSQELSFQNLVIFNQFQDMEKAVQELLDPFYVECSRKCEELQEEIACRDTTAAEAGQDRGNAVDVVGTFKRDMDPALEQAMQQVQNLFERHLEYETWKQQKTSEAAAAMQREIEAGIRLLESALTTKYQYAHYVQQYEREFRDRVCGMRLEDLDRARHEETFDQLMRDMLEQVSKQKQLTGLAAEVFSKVFACYQQSCELKVHRDDFWSMVGSGQGLDAHIRSLSGSTSGGIGSHLLAALSTMWSRLRNRSHTPTHDLGYFRQAHQVLQQKLAGVTCYSAAVVLAVADSIKRLLPRGVDEQTIRCLHTAVAADLALQLRRKQERWDEEHSVLKQLERRRPEFKAFFELCVSGERGTKRLAAEVGRIVAPSGEAGLKEAFQWAAAAAIGKRVQEGDAEFGQPHKVWQQQPWVKHYDALQLAVQSDLAELATRAREKQDAKALEEVLEAAISPKDHRERTLLRLIAQTLSEDVMQALWTRYIQAATAMLKAAASEATMQQATNVAMQAPRTYTFLAELTGRHSSLPTNIKEALANLRSTMGRNYADSDQEIEFSKVAEMVVEQLRGCNQPHFSREELAQVVLHRLRTGLPDGSQSAMQPRCTDFCALCNMHCDRPAGHLGRHDCNHQVEGLGGVRDTHTKQLWTATCAQNINTGKRFLYPFDADKEDQANWHKYADYPEVFPDWEKPSIYMRDLVRERVFVDFNHQVAERLGCKPSQQERLQAMAAKGWPEIWQHLQDRRKHFSDGTL